MADLTKQPQSHRDPVRFTSDCDYVEVREEDTEPGDATVIANHRKYMEQKYGKKAPPSANGPADGPTT